MFVNFITALVALLVVNPVTEALAHPQEIAKRTACNHDNLLRALLQSSVTASSFCSSFIPIPTATSYIHPTPTITPTLLVTIRYFLCNIVSLIYNTYSVSSTVTLSAYLVYPDGTHLESVAIPTFISTYPVSRISSACSCLSLPQPFTTVTVTQSTQVRLPSPFSISTAEELNA